MRSTLGAAMQCIRFPCMNLQEYADCVCPTDMLNVNETNNIFLYLTATQKPAVEYPTVPRLDMKPITSHRFQSSAYRYVVTYFKKIILSRQIDSGVFPGVPPGSPRPPGPIGPLKQEKKRFNPIFI